MNKLLMAVLLACSARIASAQSGLTWPTNHFLPTFATPATNIAYLTHSSDAELTLFVSLEGIVNRMQPRVAVQSTDWLGIHNLNYTTLANPYSAITNFGTNVTGLVVPDTNLPDTLDLATTIAGVKNELICDQSLLHTLTNAPYNLPLNDDLRGKFTDKYAVYGYLYTNYWNQCTHRLIAGMNTNVLGSLRDYCVAVKTACVWLDGSVPADAAALAPFMTNLAPGAMWIGYYPSEALDEEWIAQYGVPTLDCSTYNNGTVFGGISMPVNIPPIPPSPPLTNKIYIAFVMSDGGMPLMQSHMYSSAGWFDPARGTFPLGWTMTPLCCEMDPGMLNYYWTNSTPNDDLLSGPNGAGYSHIEFWSATNVNAFTAAASPYLQKSGARSIVVFDTLSATNARTYASNCPSLLGLIDLDDGFQETNYNNLAVIGFPYGARLADSPDILLNGITNQTASWDGKSPMFVMAQATVWFNTPTQVKAVADSLGTNYEVVRPDTLFLLYRQYAGLGPAAAAPYVAYQPADLSVVAGTNASFSAVVAGSAPLSYQWQFNGTNITGATNATYTAFNVRSSDAGNYSVTVTNIAGSVTSSNAVLSIAPFGPSTPTNGLVFYYNLNETTGYVVHDLSTNGNLGALIGTNWPGDPGVIAPVDSEWITNGYVANALHFNPAVSGSAIVPTRVTVDNVRLGGKNIWANSPATTNSRTWAVWVRLGTNTSFQNVMSEPTGAGAGNNLGFDTDGLTPRVVWNNGGTGGTTTTSAGGPIALGVWTHLAVTYDYQNRSNITLYVNGTAQGSSALTTVRAYSSTNILGTRGNYEFGLTGDMDEVYVYNRVLSATEIATLAGIPIGPPTLTTPVKNTVVSQGDLATMSVGAVGVGSLSYQWYKGNTLQSGATNAVYTNSLSAQPTDAGVYTVVVTNTLGAVTSSASLFVRPTMVIGNATPGWVSTNGLVFYWNLDNTTNFEALDYSGNNNHGKLINFPFDGSQQTNGFIGGGLHIQAIGGSLPQVVVTNLPLISSLTWSCWVKAKPLGNGALISASFPSAAAGHSLGFGSGTNDMHPRILWNNGVSSTTFQAPESADYNDWNEIGCTYDAPSTTMTVYLNGKPVGVNNLCSSTPFNWMAIGLRLASQQLNINGDMDEVLCYSRALAPVEMLALYTNSLNNGQVPFRSVQVATTGIRVDTTNAPYGVTNYFVNLPTNGGFLEVDTRTLWTNGVTVLQGSTNLANPSGWQPVTGVQWVTTKTPEFVGAVVMTNAINNLQPPVLFLRSQVTPPGPLFADDFQSGAPGWTHGGTSDSWALGVPTNPDGPVSGPVGRTSVYGTGLSSDYNGGEAAWLHSPAVNLAGLQQATIVYWEWANFFPNSTYEYGQVNLVDANTQQPVANNLWQISGSSTNYTADGWVQRVVEIPSPSTMSATNVMIEFMMNSDPFNPAAAGWSLGGIQVLRYGNTY